MKRKYNEKKRPENLNKIRKRFNDRYYGGSIFEKSHKFFDYPKKFEKEPTFDKNDTNYSDYFSGKKRYILPTEIDTISRWGAKYRDIPDTFTRHDMHYLNYFLGNRRYVPPPGRLETLWRMPRYKEYREHAEDINEQLRYLTTLENPYSGYLWRHGMDRDYYINGRRRIMHYPNHMGEINSDNTLDEGLQLDRHAPPPNAPYPPVGNYRSWVP